MERYDRASRKIRPIQTARKSAPTTFTKSEPPRPPKRRRTMYDLGDTFEVIVGKTPSPSRSFILYTHVFTEESTFLAAYEQQHGPLAADTPRRIHLETEDPELFQVYINCVYFGVDMMQQLTDASAPLAESQETRNQKQQAAEIIYEKQIKLYLLAKRLNDYKTANRVIDELIRFSDVNWMIPGQLSLSCAFAGTSRDEPLRMLLQDLWIYDAPADSSEKLRTEEFPNVFIHDLAIGLFEVDRLTDDERDWDRSVRTICGEDPCHYHLHDETHPRCVSHVSEDNSGK